jgi:hypothetical protein
MHRVMDLKGVSEFAVIEEYYLLLILADKVSKQTVQTLQTA